MKEKGKHSREQKLEKNSEFSFYHFFSDHYSPYNLPYYKKIAGKEKIQNRTQTNKIL